MALSADELDAQKQAGAGFFRWAVIGFVVACVALFFAASLIEPTNAPKGYPVIPAAMPHPDGDGSFLLTVDTSHRHRWIGIDLGQGRAVHDGLEPDLRVQRYVFQVPAGAIDLGPVALKDARLPEEPVWQSDVDVDGSPQNPAIARWYEYGYSSHLLTTKHHTYALRLKDGASVAFVQVVSYYCSPDGSGCLTLRFRLSG